MKKEKEIPDVIKVVFELMGKKTTTKKPVEWRGFIIVDLEVDDITIGIGTNKEFTRLKFYLIKKDVHYEKYDHRRYKETFRIGLPDSCGKNKYWSFELENQKLTIEPWKLHLIHQHIKAVNKIIELLVIAYHSTILIPKQ